MELPKDQAEIVTELAAEQVRRNAIFADIESLQANEAKADAKIADLTAALAEAKKPIKRLGDMFYGSTTGKLALMTRISPTSKAVYGDGTSVPMYDNPKYNRSIPVLNCFDHFKALQEDVTEFEIAEKDRSTNPVTMKVVNMSFIEGTGVQIRLSGSNPFAYNMSLSELSAYILKMQQLEATMKRNK